MVNLKSSSELDSSMEEIDHDHCPTRRLDRSEFHALAINAGFCVQNTCSTCSCPIESWQLPLRVFNQRKVLQAKPFIGTLCDSKSRQLCVGLQHQRRLLPRLVQAQLPRHDQIGLLPKRIQHQRRLLPRTVVSKAERASRAALMPRVERLLLRRLRRQLRPAHSNEWETQARRMG